MFEEKIYFGAQIVSILLMLGLTVWVFRLREDKLSKVESIPRNRSVGGILGLLGLIWAIPHAQPIVFNWMLPLLWPMAIGGAVAAYLLLDYLFSRAVGGILILGAYYFVHSAFEFHTQGLALIAICYWIWGILGICFSGKPCWMRDLIRKSCKDWRYRLALGLLSATTALITLVGLLSGKVE